MTIVRCNVDLDLFVRETVIILQGNNYLIPSRQCLKILAHNFANQWLTRNTCRMFVPVNGEQE
jgi:hypothetical protein